ncbi:MAG: protein kinase [Candidatus Melainabacteria bacterium]|nr:protein kinase [Candidatus Melainabacteria bacterium]
MLPSEETTCVPKPDPYAGKVIDKYRLIERLGAGGMGWVYRAEQARIKRHVAVKLLPFTMGNDEVNVKRIEREATAMGNLRHPNIATIFDFGFSDEGQPYLVMELISGRSLGNLLLEEKTLEPLRAIKIMAQIADAMDYAHKNSIIHRDLKPDNIMLTWEHKDDFVKILDFGIAKSVDTVINVSQSLTRPGTVVGSPLYMSPEQCLGQKLDSGSDIYSLGVVLYEAVTGTVPCKGATMYETIWKKSTEAPPLFPDHCAEWKDLERLVLSCLAPMRADRPESMLTVRDMLLALQPATVDLAMPASVQISATAESAAIAQSPAINIPPLTQNAIDVYDERALTPVAQDVNMLDGDTANDNSSGQIVLQTPSQVMASISDVTGQDNTVLTSFAPDTANEIEAIASGIETEASFATVSTGHVVSGKHSKFNFNLDRKTIAVAAGAVIALGGLSFNLLSGGATRGGALTEPSGLPSVNTIAPVSAVSTESRNSSRVSDLGDPMKARAINSDGTPALSNTAKPSRFTPENLSGSKPANSRLSSGPAEAPSSLNGNAAIPTAPSRPSASKSSARSAPNVTVTQPGSPKSRLSAAKRQARIRRSVVQRQPRSGTTKPHGPLKRFWKHLRNARF